MKLAQALAHELFIDGESPWRGVTESVVVSTSTEKGGIRDLVDVYVAHREQMEQGGLDTEF